MKHRVLLAFGLVLLMSGPALGASPVPRILLGRKGGSPVTVYKPRNFFPSAHYQVTRAHWIKWNRNEAVARAVLRVQFPGAPARVQRTTITYSKPKQACGAYTYTEFSSASGANAKLVVERGGAFTLCLFVIQ